MISLVGRHLVLPGRLPPDLARLVSHMQKDREDADYVTSSVFTDRDAEEAIANAERFLEVARQLVGEDLERAT